MLRENIFISICSIFFFLSGCILVNGSYPAPPIISLVFWSTLLVYYINTSVKFNFLNLNSYSTLLPPFGKKAKNVLFLSGLILAHTPFLNIKTLIFLFHLGLISTLYNVPEKIKGSFHFPFRSIPILKVFLIAYVWASISSFLPAILVGEQVFTSSTLLIFFAHFMFIFAITLPFDVRDFQIDQNKNLTTIPHLIGIIPTKLLAIVCLIIFFLIINHVNIGWQVIPLCLLTVFLILNSSAKKKKYYFTFFLDGTIIFYFISLMLSLP